MLILPLVIVGPAIVKWNGYAYYFEDGLTVDFSRETFKIKNDFSGQMDERAKSQKTLITGKPAGLVNYLTPSSGKSAIFPYGLSVTGTSIFGTTALPLVIQTQFGGASNTGQTITYVRGGMSKFASLTFHSQSPLYGGLEFTTLGAPTVQNNTAGSWNAIVDAAFADTTFDTSEIVTDNYTIAFGSSPYNAMGAHNGVEVDISLETNPIYSDDYGVTDMTIDSMSVTTKFAPSNLTETQIWTMLNAQGTGFIQPGMSIAAAGTSLVITGSGNASHTVTATIPNMGAKDGGFVYNKKDNRVKQVMFTGQRTTTTGVVNPLATFATT